MPTLPYQKTRDLRGESIPLQYGPVTMDMTSPGVKGNVLEGFLPPGVDGLSVDAVDVYLNAVTADEKGVVSLERNGVSVKTWDIWEKERAEVVWFDASANLFRDVGANLNRLRLNNGSGSAVLADADLTNAVDVSVTLRDSMNPAVLAGQVCALSTTRAIYLCFQDPGLLRVAIEVSAANANAVTLDVEVWGGGTTWTDVAGLTDGTAAGGATLAQSGVVSWNALTGLVYGAPAFVGGPTGQQGYWIRLRASGAVTGTTAIREIWPQETIVASGSEYLASSDYLYVISPFRFSGVRFTMKDVNGAGSAALTGEYFNGLSDDLGRASNWTALASLSDGTISGGKTFGQTGDVTWTVPRNHAPAVIAANSPSVRNYRGYIVRFKISATLAGAISFYGVAAIRAVTAWHRLFTYDPEIENGLTGGLTASFVEKATQPAAWGINITDALPGANAAAYRILAFNRGYPYGAVPGERP